MSNEKPQRQSANRAARVTQQRQDATRRRWLRIGVSIVAVATLVGATLAVFIDGGDGSTSATGTSSTQGSTATTQPTVPSAAGKPCVAVTDPLPQGAPAVPVQVGPPPTTLVVQDLTPGTGATVEPTSTVTVDYIGVSCSTGAIFDSSYSRGQPTTFPLNQVIPGWSQGLTGMKVGGSRLLGIPADLAYGTEGRPPTIAPDEALWFVVDVRNVQAAGTTAPAPAG